MRRSPRRILAYRARGHGVSTPGYARDTENNNRIRKSSKDAKPKVMINLFILTASPVVRLESKIASMYIMYYMRRDTVETNVVSRTGETTIMGFRMVICGSVKEKKKKKNEICLKKTKRNFSRKRFQS